MIFAFYDDQSKSGMRAYTSLRKARSARAKQFPKRADRPEIYGMDLKPYSMQQACNLLSQTDFSGPWKEFE